VAASSARQDSRGARIGEEVLCYPAAMIMERSHRAFRSGRTRPSLASSACRLAIAPPVPRATGPSATAFLILSRGDFFSAWSAVPCALPDLHGPREGRPGSRRSRRSALPDVAMAARRCPASYRSPW